MPTGRPTEKSRGQVITSDWANQIRDQLVLYFADSVARDAAIPTPTAGMAVYLASTKSLTVYDSSHGWKPPWNLPWGRQNGVLVTSGVTGGSSATMADTAGMTFTFNAVTGRRYRLYLQTQWTCSGDTEIQTQVLIGGTRYLTAVGSIVSGDYFNLNGVMEVSGLTTGTLTVKLQHANSAAVAISPSYSATAPWHLGIDDVGPDAVS